MCTEERVAESGRELKGERRRVCSEEKSVESSRG